MENLRKKVLEEIDKAVIGEKRVGLITTDLEKRIHEKKRKIERVLDELKGAGILIESKFGLTRVYSPREMVDSYINKRKRGK